MNSNRTLLSLLLLPITLLAANTVSLSTTKELRQAIFDNSISNQTFSLSATFITNFGPLVFLEDASGGMCVDARKLPLARIYQLKPGDKISITGKLNLSEHGRPEAFCESLTLISAGNPTPSRKATGQEIATGTWDYRAITIQGTIIDAFADEIDPGYIYFSIACDGYILLNAQKISEFSTQKSRELIGSYVEISGICDPLPHTRRKPVRRMLHSVKSFQILSPAKTNVFDNPTAKHALPPLNDIRAIPDRRTFKGHVLVIWKGNNALLQSHGATHTENVRVSFASDCLPKCGTHIEVSGFPGSDTYEPTLQRADWRPTDAQPLLEKATPQQTSIKQLKADEQGRHRFHPYLINRLVTVRGRVRTSPDLPHNPTIILEDDNIFLTVDVTACPQIFSDSPNGCTIDVTGYLIPDINECTPTIIFPEIKDLFVAIRSPDDILIVARPPWWTPFRLFVAILILVIVIVGIVFWNVMLRRLAERRGRELAAETVSHAEANMRTFERTRLAVELHDALSQNLTGVAMRIQAAEQYAEGASPELTENLSIAERTLKSCRTELKNCLWDLRNQALEEATIDGAIRLTLKPYLSNVTLALRFNVPRSRVTDNTTHTLLRIIRELAVNGIRHGHASEIKIAGSIEDNVLKFSVADNGCGFDPNLCPSVDQGHFGLEGIRERIRLMSGTMTVKSQPGQGSKTTIALHMPKEC